MKYLLLCVFILSGCASVGTKSYTGTPEQQAIQAVKAVDPTAKDFSFGIEGKIRCGSRYTLYGDHYYKQINFNTNRGGLGYQKKSSRKGNIFYRNGKFLGIGYAGKPFRDASYTSCTFKPFT